MSYSKSLGVTHVLPQFFAHSVTLMASSFICGKCHSLTIWDLLKIIKFFFMNLEWLKQQSKECSKLSANNTSDKMLIFIICTALKPQL